MRKSLFFVAILGAFVVQGCNQQPAQEAAAPAEPGTHSTTGQITVVNDDSVMIEHGPIAELNWPAMTMKYEVPDAAMVADVKPGEAVRFSFKREGFGYVITNIAQQ